MSRSPDIVLDTNAVLDWLVFRDPHAAALGRAIESRQLNWLATAAMRIEFDAVLSREALLPWRAQAPTAATAWEAFARIAELEPAASPLRCRDPDDQIFIDLALQRRCAWLFSRDRALLALSARARAWGLTVAKPSEFQVTNDVLALTHIVIGA